MDTSAYCRRGAMWPVALIFAIFIGCVTGVPRSAIDNSIATGKGRVTFAPGLKTLTFYDKDQTNPDNSPRKKFLNRLRAGLEAEKAVRTEFRKRAEEALDLQGDKEIELDEEQEDVFVSRIVAMQKEEDSLGKRAFDEAVNRFDQTHRDDSRTRGVNSEKRDNAYQFVGVVDPKAKTRKAQQVDSEASVQSSAIKWYARKKPKNASWSMRLVHVDRAAIFHELYKRTGKFDIFASYKAVSRDPNSGRARVRPYYTARPRTWYTLWNLNPLDFFTQRSGNKFRDRRLPEGLYTDGADVYETSYDYKFGRNGMKSVGTLDEFADSEEGRFVLDDTTRSDLESRLEKGGSPDIVVEF